MNNSDTPSRIPRKLGLALGAGGGRAFAHVGVWRALRAEGIVPHCVTGASMGAVIAALIAIDGDGGAERALSWFATSPDFGANRWSVRGDGLHRRRGRAGRFVKKLATFGIAAGVSFFRGLRRRHPLYGAVDTLFGDRRIESLALPFGCVALDLTAGRVASFREGALGPALKAGSTVGLVFPPFRWEGREYVDAAPLCPVPAGLCREMGADVVVAVDVGSPAGEAEIDTGFDVVRRIVAAQTDALTAAELGRADVVIRPGTDDVHWGDFTRGEELAARGERATREAMDTIRALV